MTALLFCVVCAALFAQQTPATNPAAASVRVMTFNLRYAAPAGPDSWPLRRPVMKTLITRQRPDLMGTQEGLELQLRDLDADLGPAYARFGQGREGKLFGEHSCVYYNVERFELLRHDDFWLSEQPEKVGSIAWGATLPRMVSWGELRDKATGKTFFAFNTHFDHASEQARVKSAALLRDRIKQIASDATVICTGDFNAPRGASPAYTTLTAEDALFDCWEKAADKGPAVGTFHNFGPVFPKGPQIDWVLYRGKVSVKSVAVDEFRVGKQAPSDHCPVVADLTLQ